MTTTSAAQQTIVAADMAITGTMARKYRNFDRR